MDELPLGGSCGRATLPVRNVVLRPTPSVPVIPPSCSRAAVPYTVLYGRPTHTWAAAPDGTAVTSPSIAVVASAHLSPVRFHDFICNSISRESATVAPA